MLDKVKSFLSTIGTDLKDTWNRSKMVILAVGALILALEFRKLKEFLLVYAGKKEIDKDKKEDSQLKAKEDSANAQADALVKQAKEEPSKETPVGDDWNSK